MSETAIPAESQGEVREGTARGSARVHALPETGSLPFDGRRPRCPLEGTSGDQRPHVELSIHWSPANVQRVLALVDTGENCSLIHENPEQFPRSVIQIDGFRGQIVRVKAVSVPLGIATLPPCTYTVYVSPLPEYILGVDVLHGLSLQTSVRE